MGEGCHGTAHPAAHRRASVAARKLAHRGQRWHASLMWATSLPGWAAATDAGATERKQPPPTQEPAWGPRPFRAAAFAVIALSILAAPIGSGCPRGEPGKLSTLPVVTTDDPEAEADLRAAREAADANQATEATRLYEAFLREHADDPMVPVAKLGLGRMLLAEGDVERARGLFGEVRDHEDPALADRARFYHGVALHLAGHNEQALEALRPYVGRTVDPEDTALLLRTIAAASLHRGDAIAAVEALDQLVRAAAPEEDREQARAQIARIIEETADATEVQELYDRLPPSGIGWTIAADRAAHESYEAGDMARVREIIEALREYDVELDEDLQSMAVRAERTGQAQPNTIGAILPLTGRGREVGQLALRGLMLAGGTPPEEPMADGAPQIVFRDDAGDPERAVQAVNDLVSLHRVIAIVGPIDSAAAASAARRAQEVGVPLIALSPAEALTETGTFVFRLLASPREETRELVAAAKERGARRFAVLHPKSGYGQAMAEAYARVVADAQGELVARVSYPAEATSFGEPLRELGRSRFDALFVPDAAARLALIVPALAAAGLWPSPRPPEDASVRTRFTLLAPSVALSDDLLQEAGRYLDGALFTQPFHTPTASGRGRAFAEEFQDRYGRRPDTFAAHAYDALQLIAEAVRGGARTREDLAARLRESAGAATVGASRGVRPDGAPWRGPRVLELTPDGLRPVAVPAPVGQSPTATGRLNLTSAPTAVVQVSSR